MTGAQTEEEAILIAQQLDLIYSQSIMLYKILPNVAQAKMDLTKTTPNPHVDGVIVFEVGQVMSSMGKSLCNKILTNPTLKTTLKTNLFHQSIVCGDILTE